MFYFEKMEVNDFRNDVLLAEACRSDVDKYCKHVEPGAHSLLSNLPALASLGGRCFVCFIGAPLGPLFYLWEEAQLWLTGQAQSGQPAHHLQHEDFMWQCKHSVNFTAAIGSTIGHCCVSEHVI